MSRLTRRALDEIPHHLSRLDVSESKSRWNEIWSDPGWLLTKLATSGVTQVMEDFALTPDLFRPEPVKEWMALIVPAIDYDYRQLASQLIGRGVVPQTGLLEELCRNPLVACLVPSCPSCPVQPTEASDSDICISAIYRLNSDERHHAAALSAVCDELSLWDFNTGQCDKGTATPKFPQFHFISFHSILFYSILLDAVLGNLQHQPLKVAPLANDRCVVLCGRELRVYDMNTGQEVLKLKGMISSSSSIFSCFLVFSFFDLINYQLERHD